MEGKGRARTGNGSQKSDNALKYMNISTTLRIWRNPRRLRNQGEKSGIRGIIAQLSGIIISCINIMHFI